MRAADDGAAFAVTAEDVAAARCDVVADRGARGREAEVRDAAWPELAALDAAWRDAGRALPADAAETRAFLETRAYADRALRLPLASSAVDDLARHLFRYLTRE